MLVSPVLSRQTRPRTVCKQSTDRNGRNNRAERNVETAQCRGLCNRFAEADIELAIGGHADVQPPRRPRRDSLVSAGEPAETGTAMVVPAADRVAVFAAGPSLV